MKRKKKRTGKARVLILNRNINIGTKRYLAISRKSEKLVAGANTRKQLAQKLKKKRGDFWIIETPKVREASIMTVQAALIPKWRRSKEYRKYHLPPILM